MTLPIVISTNDCIERMESFVLRWLSQNCHDMPSDNGRGVIVLSPWIGSIKPADIVLHSWRTRSGSVAAAVLMSQDSHCGDYRAVQAISLGCYCETLATIDARPRPF